MIHKYDTLQTLHNLAHMATVRPHNTNYSTHTVIISIQYYNIHVGCEGIKGAHMSWCGMFKVTNFTCIRHSNRASIHPGYQIFAKRCVPTQPDICMKILLQCLSIGIDI